MCWSERGRGWPAPLALALQEAKVRQARARCARCPVRPECLAWALSTVNRVAVPVWGRGRVITGYDVTEYRVRDDPAIYAGTTPAERRAVEGLAFDEQVRVLTEQFRAKVTTGPWRVAATAEVAA